MTKPQNLIKKFSTGAITATVWLNEGLNNEGEIVTFKTIAFERRYLDKNTNEWKSTSSLRQQDLPKALLVLNKAYEFLTLKDEVEEDGE